MKLSPILFTTENVQGIQQLRKTETRRTKGLKEINKDPDKWVCHKDLGWQAGKDIVKGALFQHTETKETKFVKLPYGFIGDVMWVRETWRKYYRADEYGYTHFDQEVIEYSADNPEPVFQMDGNGFIEFNKDGSEKFIPWKPSIFMPKEACRLFLKNEFVRLERLQEITDDGAIAEGVEFHKPVPGDGLTIYKNYTSPKTPFYGDNAKLSFQTLWQSIHGEESWDKNPWVWVYKFSITDKPENFK